MKNVQNFIEFVNEAEYYTLANMIEDAPESYEDERDIIWDLVQKKMKIKNPKDLGIVTSDDESKDDIALYKSLESNFNGDNINLGKDAWGYYYFDKKLNVCKMEDQGISAYYFNMKDAKKLLK